MRTLVKDSPCTPNVDTLTVGVVNRGPLSRMGTAIEASTKVFAGPQSIVWVGTSPLTMYIGPGQGALAMSTTAYPAGVNRLWMVVPPFNCTIDTLISEVTTAGVSGVFRMGIYRARSREDFAPNTLLIDGGELSSATTGLKTSTVSVNLNGGEVYYLSILGGTATATFATMPSGGISPITPASAAAPPTSVSGAVALGFTTAYGALADITTAGSLGTTACGVFAHVTSAP